MPKYHLISISILSGFFYLLSWLAVQSGLLSKVYHKRFWNSILLFSFIISAGFGMFLVFQINYDWDIALADDLTFWHVDVGIVLFWIAVFHIFWHLSYFGKLFRKTKPHTDEKTHRFIDKKLKIPLKYAALSLGVSAFFSQIVFIRAFLSIFSGNELIIGIILFNWLAITGFGAYAGQYAYRLNAPLKTLKFLLLNMALLPFITFSLIIVLKNNFFQSGTETGLSQIVFYSFFLLLPFNLFSGFSFALLSHIAANIYQDKKAHLIYAYEAFGSLLAGLLFNFLLIYLWDDFRILLLLLPLNLFVVEQFSRRKYVFLTFGLIIFAVLFYFPVEKIIKEQLFINQKIIYQQNSPYGNIILSENSGQINFYQNGDYLFSSDTIGSGSGNIAENEEAVHFALLQIEKPKNVLLVSGGVNGQLQEILKYPVQRIDYLEINPALIKAARQYIKLPESSKINYINDDARHFLAQSKARYDAILLNVPPPLTAETNRYYTYEFFRILKQHLRPKGIIKTQLPSSANYLSDDAAFNFSVLYATLAALFKNVRVINGENDYFLASDKAINLNMVAEISRKQIPNEYIQYYLDDFSINQRAEVIEKRIKNGKKINHDFKPLAYPALIKYQLSKFKTNYWILAVFFVLFLIFVIKNTGKKSLGMFAVGFVSMTAELLIIFGLQILYGNIYSMLSIVVMIFMSGLAIGALYLHRFFTDDLKYHYKIAFWVLAVSLIVLPVLFIYVFPLIKIFWLSYALIFIITFIISVLCGYVFYLSEQLNDKQSNRIAGKLYSTDLFGSAIAALLVSMFLLPLAGIMFVGVAGALFCLFINTFKA